MEFSDTIRLCNLSLKGADPHLRNLQCLKIFRAFQKPAIPVKKRDGDGEGRKGGKEEREGGNGREREGMIGEGD
jgi:hypothetical protein